MNKYIHNRSTSVSIISTVLVAASLGSANILAQSAEPEAFLIEELIVTVAKRQQTLQETPVSASVITADNIEKAQIRTINDLQSVVPSLRVVQLNTSTDTQFRIRGFGNGTNNAGIEPSVGVFVDGVYRSRNAGSIGDLPFLDRIEVLRGPQSTLFGKNATAGVISVVTAKPSGESSGNLSATVGRFNELIIKGQYEDAISDNAAFSISGGFNNRDGYAENPVTGNDLNNRDRQNIRGQITYEPSESTRFRFIADYDTLEEACCAVVNLSSSDMSPIIPAFTGQPFVVDPSTLDVPLSQDPLSQVDNGGLSIHFDQDFDDLTLTSITAYRTVDSETFFDVDFSAVDAISADNSQEIDTFTQELRLTSNYDGPINWMIGGFYFDEDVEANEAINFGSQLRPLFDAATMGGLALFEDALPGVEVGTFFNTPGVAEVFTLENQSLSLFGTFDVDFTEKLTLNLGANYTFDEKDFTGEQTLSEPFSGLDLVEIGFAGIFTAQTGMAPTPENIAAFATANPAAFAGLQAAANDPTINTALGLQALQLQPQFVDFPNAVEDGNVEDDNFSFSARLSYDVSDDWQIFAGVGTGFRAASVNLTRDSRPLAADTAALDAAGLLPNNVAAGTRFALPEESEVVEIGVKARFKRGNFALTLFDQNIENFQSNVFTGTGFALTNAGEVSNRGAEVEFTYLIADGLKINFAGTYFDPQFDSFENALVDPLTGQGVDLTGQVPAGFSEFSFNTGIDYSFDIGGVNAFVRANYFFEDEVQVRDGTPADIASRETRIVNASAGIFIPGVDISASIYARNLTDFDPLIAAFPNPLFGFVNGYRIEPRTFGLTVSKDF